MAKFVIQGEAKLEGTVKVQGSKNAAFPVFAASILADGPCRIQNLPDIKDVRSFFEILRFLGATVDEREREAIIDARSLINRPLPADLMSKLRGSVLLAGALLARFGYVKFAFPGGDTIGRRPIDEHLEGFRKLGARVNESGDWFEISADKLSGARIVLGFTTVTGTENLILASVLAHGTTQIKLAACEPHVQALCRFLNLCGAKIEGIGSPNLAITGVGSLHGAQFVLNPDEIVTVTYCVAAAATRGEVRIEGADIEVLDAPLAVLHRMGVNFETRENSLLVKCPVSDYQATKIVTGVYPQLLTDYQPMLGVLATQANGVTSIHDWIYEGRQGYLKALEEMGAKVEYEDLHKAKVYGPVQLHGAEIKTPDIRAGASILIAGLIAKGQSVLYNAEIIDRGYEKIDEVLRGLGADIQRVE